jgi:hypothetical protein
MAFAPANPLYNRRAPGYLRGFIRKTLRKVIVILSHYAERGLPGSPTMIVGKHLMQVGQLLVSHGTRPFLERHRKGARPLPTSARATLMGAT